MIPLSRQRGSVGRGKCAVEDSMPDEEVAAESTKEAQEKTSVVETEKADSETATKTEESPKEMKQKRKKTRLL